MTDAEFRKFESTTPASEVLPFVFKNGLIVSNLGIYCGGCGQDVPSTQIRGTVLHIYEHCISFSGLGLCYECRTITSIECRFADDASFLEKSGDAWIHHMINQDEPGLIVTAWRYFKSLANRLKGPS